MKIRLITSLFLLFLGFSQVHAQEQAKKTVTESLSGVKWVKIYSSSSVVVKGEQRSDMQITSHYTEKNPEKAQGLKAVYAGGDDNTGIAVNVTVQEGGTMIVSYLRNGSNGYHNKPVEITLPSTMNVAVISTGLGSVDIEGFTGEVEADAGSVGHLKIKDVQGPVTASSTTGNIDVVFDKINQSAPISITSTTADVDVTLPANTPANLKLSATMGNIYTNFDLDIPNTDKNGLKRMSGGQKISSKINNGGVQITLRNTTGDIYLRKQ